MKRSATANWQGTGKEGKGTVSTQSGVLKNSQYSWHTRFENGIGTNPEELVAAAHAGCFSMKLSFNLTKAGFPPQNIDTDCEVDFDTAKSEIVTSHLRVKVKAAGIDKTKFDELVADAKANCPISKLLKAAITCDATLA
jgi:osmotically inducible protein OsmC